ncbi:hypothetical protein [Flavobacterium subsaxonicum]|nr:hypothetical protein [Flavobacterium subsaxonicum]
MNNLIYLRCNTETVIFNNVRYGTGQVSEFLKFFPGELWYDDQGLVRQFSLKFDNGDVGNFFLMPLTPDRDKYVRAIVSDLTEFGLKMTANAIFSGGAVIVNLAKFLFEKYGKVVLADVINRQATQPMGYVAIDNQEVVFQDPKYVQSAAILRELLFYVKNDYAFDVVYQVSRDMANWIPGIIRARKSVEVFFTNRQVTGYLRVMTGQRPGRAYRVDAKKSYAVFWQENGQYWDLLEIKS